MKTSHRLLLEHYLIPILKNNPNWGRVLDVGSKDARYKQYVQHNKYTTLDCEPSYNTDIVSKIEDYDGKEVYDLVLCNQVLEHVKNPQLAIDSIHRALKKGGTAIISVPWIFPTHSDADYHRFNYHTIHLLFKDWTSFKITPYGNLISSSWQVFNFPNYLGFLNHLIALIGRYTITSCADGFIVEAHR